MEAMPPPGWEIEDSEVDNLILGRNYEGPWDNECSDQQLEQAFDVFWLSGGVPICPATGLPDRFVESRFWEVINRLWRACHFKERASCFDKRLFDKFLKGQLIERKEADWTVSLFIRVCGCLPIRENGWEQILRLVRFLSQHGASLLSLGERMSTSGSEMRS
jgi:hypothetical protein